MAMVVKVRFKRASKLYDFDANDLDLHTGMFVVTETARGVELGECMSGVFGMDDEFITNPLKPIIRIATEQDLITQKKNEESEKEAFAIALEKIAEHELEMKLVDVEYAFDHSKIIFYFTANGRVDFRLLVKNLAGIFKTRIELRQIGVRDEAKMLGGIGPCGRPICCRTFLSDFTPVSIKMAKEQNLSLNPTKISGLCDRLMCCLKYEQDHYEVTRKRMPRVGREIITPDGPGTINAINVLEETVRVRIAVGDSFEIREYPIDDCKRQEPHPAAERPAAMEKREQQEKRAEAVQVEEAVAEQAQEQPDDVTQAPQQVQAVAQAKEEAPEVVQKEATEDAQQEVKAQEATENVAPPRPEKQQRPQRPHREERPRGERPPRPEKPQRSEQQPRPEKPQRGERPPRPVKQHGERPERQQKGERPPRNEQQMHQERQPRPDRPPRTERPPRAERPQRQENAQQGERPPRPEKQRRPDRPPRTERPPRKEQSQAPKQQERVKTDAPMIDIQETSGLQDLL